MKNSFSRLLTRAFLCAGVVCAAMAQAEEGLRQVIYSTGYNVTTGDPLTDGGGVVVPGALFACSLPGTGYLYATDKGVLYTLAKNQTAAYKGFWYMKGGVAYNFAHAFCKVVRLYITPPGGTKTTVISSDTWGTSISTAQYTPAADGWYTIEIRVGSSNDSIGPQVSLFKDVLEAGFVWNDAGLTACTPENAAQWRRFMNTPGETIFYTAIPTGVAVVGSPANVGTVTPAYGWPIDPIDGETCTFAAPAAFTNDVEGVRATCLGWTLTLTNGTETSGPEFSKSIVYSELHNRAKLTWRWTAECKVVASFPDGTVGINGGAKSTSTSAWVPYGSTVTVDFATPSGKALDWSGVPSDGYVDAGRISFAATNGVSLTAAQRDNRTLYWRGGTSASAALAGNWAVGPAADAALAAAAPQSSSTRMPRTRT